MIRKALKKLYLKISNCKLQKFFYLCCWHCIFSSNLTAPKRPEILQFFNKFFRGPLFQEYQRQLGSFPTFQSVFSFFFQFLADWKIFSSNLTVTEHRICYKFLNLKTKFPLFSNFDLSISRSGRSNCETSNRFGQLSPVSKSFNQVS